MIGEYSCGFSYHMNEYDEKLNTFTIQEEDQKSILIIGGIHIFLPNNTIEASAHDKSATGEEIQPTETIRGEEMDQTLMSTPAEVAEHSEELPKIFNQEVETEMNAVLKPAKEEETGSMDFADPYEELEALERRGMVQILHIRQVNLEADQEVYQQKQSCQKKMGLHN
jgi:hypothetical protein